MEEEGPSRALVVFGSESGTAEKAIKELAAQWSGFMDAAVELSPEQQAAIATRDALIRRVAADSSPDNANRERVFGAAAFARTKALLCGELP